MRQLQAINIGLDTVIQQAEIILKVLILTVTLIPLPLPHQLKQSAELSLIGQALLWKLSQDGK